MLFRQIERIERSRLIDRLVVATSTDSSDDVLAQECLTRGIEVHRGSMFDVLRRFAAAARLYCPTSVVRLTGDCPLADWDVIDLAIDKFVAGEYDYLSNVDPPTYPDGLDVEVLSYRALLETDANARLPSEREHVTLFIRRHPDLFKIGSLAQEVDLSSLRWTVDNLEDFDFVRAVYETLYPSKQHFDTADVLRLMEQRPELAYVNKHLIRNAGLSISLAAEQDWQGKEEA